MPAPWRPGPYLAAALCTCALAHWAEQRLYTEISAFPRAPQLLATFAMPGLGLAALILAGLAMALYAPLAGLFLIAVLWFVLASLGSLLVRLLDHTISAWVPDFRSRIIAAVSSLVLLVAVLAVKVGESVGRVGTPDHWLKFQFDNPKEREELLSLVDPQTASALVSFVALLFALPALLSACGKLADAVMERLHPLGRALEEVGQGHFDVRLEEGGSVELQRVATGLNQMVDKLGEARGLERAFGAYLGAPIIERIRSAHAGGTIAPSSKDATVMFADIRGFTSMSEKLTPPQVLDVLNRYLERAVAVVDAHEGYLNKFIGDAVVVIFNGPLEQKDHAARGAACALSLQAEVKRLNAANAFPEIGELKVGVGVATGPLVAGNLGTTRTEYTVIGDTVNLAARLTSQAGAGEVIVNAACAEGASAQLQRHELPPLKLKGKELPVTAFRLAQG